MKTDKSFRLQDEFTSFKEKVSSSKHAFWFDLLHKNKKWQLFLRWKLFKFGLKKKNQAPSLKRYIFEIRKHKGWSVSPDRLRESALNKILN